MDTNHQSPIHAGFLGLFAASDTHTSCIPVGPFPKLSDAHFLQRGCCSSPGGKSPRPDEVPSATGASHAACTHHCISVAAEPFLAVAWLWCGLEQRAQRTTTRSKQHFSVFCLFSPDAKKNKKRPHPSLQTSIILGPLLYGIWTARLLKIPNQGAAVVGTAASAHAISMSFLMVCLLRPLRSRPLLYSPRACVHHALPASKTRVRGRACCPDPNTKNRAKWSVLFLKRWPTRRKSWPIPKRSSERPRCAWS